ncbi:MAG TPA: HAMP domain-containing sensor histidine kinase [Oligoflexus sp.]|uniref:sensor histidine kinase n=1 Tax=Oligoflexus sp. TaxID=1971216 RepID=UPI002D7E57AF|nr:HAMP domain-containing sensor histidine kinase [Oligoflexus sp.]HET9238506.1 HAMP domain-containing sensor histidine kinase [Oligoflexus sp.]
MLHLTTAADWFLNRAQFPHSRDQIRGRTFILVLGLNLLFQTALSFLLPDEHRLFPFAVQILIQLSTVLVLLALTKITGRYRTAAVIHFVLQKVFMGLVFASSESLHSIYFASMSTDVVMASFILGLRLAIPLTVFQALATLVMVQRNRALAATLPFGMDLATYAGLLAFSILLAQFSMVLFSWLYHRSLQHDYTKLQHERSRLFRSARTFDLSRMLGEMNHHVNNPLSVIHAQLYRLTLQARKRAVPPEERQLSGASAEAMQKIRFIVEHLRLLASPDSQETISTISVRNLCLYILTHFQENFRLKGITLQFVDQTMNMSFAWRRHELFTILVAVIQNAGEAVERSVEKQVTVRIERHPAWLMLTVTDTGPGIPDEQRARLFKPFHSTKQGSRHLGLSLLTAKAVLEDRGGTISCEDVAHGCSFQIGLPLGLTGA